MEAGVGIICFVWVLTAISAIIVVARSGMKILRFHGLAWEDYLMIVSMMLAIVYGSSSTLMYTINFNNNQPLAPFLSPKFAKYLYISHATGFMAPLFSRISFCLYMLRVLGTTSATRKRSIYAFIVLQLVVNIPISILVFTQCGSFHSLWQHGLAQKATSCISHDATETLALIATIFNTATDLYLTILPGFVVWGIKVMTVRARLGLVFTLGLSFFATIASAVKIYCTYALYTFSPDARIIQHLIIVMGVEINVVIIAASIPVLAPLFLHKSGQARQRRAIYKVPVLATYDTSAKSEEGVSLQSAKTCVESQRDKRVEVVFKDLSSGTTSMLAGDTLRTPSAPWDELPEIVFLSDNGAVPFGGP